MGTIEVSLAAEFDGGCMCCHSSIEILRIAAGDQMAMITRLCKLHARELHQKLGAALRGPVVKQTDRDLLAALDVEAIGPTGLAARFTAAALRLFIRERGQAPKGNKIDLALQLSRLLKAGEK
jgi:hypothetical protein